MSRFFRIFRCLSYLNTANGKSATIASMVIIFLYFESSPTPAGADIARKHTPKHAFVIATSITAPIAAPAAKQAASDAKPETSTETQQAELTPEELTNQTLAEKIRLIEKGLEFLNKTADYTAQFVKQELVHGELKDEQEMDLKIRHSPFSIYLKWNTVQTGQEVLYVEGANDGKLAAHLGGWKARLPTVFLDPYSGPALAESRYPIMKAGLLELAKMMLDIHKNDLKDRKLAKCEKLPGQMFDNRPCHLFIVEYKDRKVSENYRKSICMIDCEWSIPVYTRNFGWLTGDAPTDPEKYDADSLLEFYSYSDIKFSPNLLAIDFDHKNEEYRFKR